jgi:hypothetical protein
MSNRNNFNDRITIYLAIESVELTPSELTTRLGSRPDRIWLMGSVRGKTGKHWDSNGWVVETTICSEESAGRSASELIPIAIERFEIRLKPFARMAYSLGDSAQRYSVLAVLAENVPAIELSHSFLQVLADLGGTLQIDLSTQPLSPVSP